MEKISKVIVVLIRKCLIEDLKGFIEFTRDDFNKIGFLSSRPLAVLLDEETKSIANGYGFDYVDILSNPEKLVFINRIEDLSDNDTQRYKMYSLENDEIHSNIIEFQNDDNALNKSICSVLQKRKILLRE